MTTTLDLESQLIEACAMPYGLAQVAAVEAVIGQADAQGRADIAYAARIQAITSYGMAGEPAKAFVPFAWCLAAHDRGEADEDLDDELLWGFKTVVKALTRFPEVPLQRTEAVVADMERRYRLAGHTLNPVHMLRTQLADHLGDTAAAAEHYRLWCATPRGELADCEGCEPTAKAYHLAGTGRDEDAVALAEPVLSGELDCAEQPAAIRTALLLPYVRTGRYEEAAEAHRLAYRRLRANRSELEAIAEHVEFCARTGNHARAVELLHRHLGWLDEPTTPMAEMLFAASAALTLRLVIRAGHGDLVFTVGGTEVAAADLVGRLSDRASAVAARFDARNGTGHQGERVRALLDAEPIVEHLPLSDTARRAERFTAAVPEPDPVPDLPEDPTALADLAEQWRRDDRDPAPVWARFDEVCPAPTGVLLARRLLRAGGQDLVADDLAAAGRSWARAAELFTEAGDVRAEVARVLWGDALTCSGRPDEGLPLVADAHAVLRQRGSAEERGFSHLALTRALWVVGRQDEALASARSAVTEAGEDTRMRARAALEVATLSQFRDDPDETAAHAELVLSLLPEAGEERHEAEVILGRLRAADGNLDAAEALFTAAAGARTLSTRAEATGLLGNVATDRGNADAAARYFADAVAMHTADGNPAEAADLGLVLAFHHLEADRAEEAADAADEALPALTDPEDVARAQYVLAQASRRLGAPDQALDLFTEVIAFYSGADNHAPLAEALTETADLLDELDRDAHAAEHYTRAAAAWAEVGEVGAELRCLRRAAFAHHWSGSLFTAATTLARADTLATAFVPEDDWGRVELVLLDFDAARILSATNRSPEATRRAEAAAVGATAMGDHELAAAAHTLHGNLLAAEGTKRKARKAYKLALRALPPADTDRRAEIEALMDAL